MGRGPQKYASNKSVLARVKRLKASNPFIKEAKYLAAQGDTVGAMWMLYQAGEITEAHVQAHLDWRDQVELEDLV